MELNALVPKALSRLNEILEIPFSPEDENYLQVVKVVRETAQTVLTTASRVDETQLRRRQVDVLPRLLDLLRQEEARTLDLAPEPQ